MKYILLGPVTIFLTYYLCVFYRKIALSNGILASLNFRTLHKYEVPKGGGIIISCVFITIYSMSYFLGLTEDIQTLYACVGALLISIFGFIDDLRNTKAIIKFIAQFCFAFIIILPIAQDQNIFDLVNLSKLFFISFFIVWMLNTLNFMDGIDGLAASMSIVIFWTLFSVLMLLGGSFSSTLSSYLLGSCCCGFLIINLSSKKLFMGDSGSLFLGYFISFLMIKTIVNSELTPFFWAILMAYALTETIATTTYRILNTKKWYGAHRSHAYQNLARIINNHVYVTLGVILYHLIFLIPLSILSIFDPIRSWLYLFLAIIPVLVFNFLYGPRLSND